MSESTAMTPPLVELCQISKAFPGTQALREVSFDLLAGEVHALIGENGAGKSTLVHILSGVLRPDSGEIQIEGRPVEINNPREAQERGIGMVYQELSLVPSLSIAENVFPNRAPTRTGGVIHWSQLYKRTRELMAQFELDVDVRTPVRALNITVRQIVEIVKALSLNAKILLLDEPSSALTVDEVARLFDVIRRLKAKGLGIVYISHRISEVMEIADRVTVLRDGHRVGTYAISAITPERLIESMVGRTLTEMFPDRGTAVDEDLLRVDGLTRDGVFWDISFQVRRGEIVGLAGLKGSRRSELLRALVGVLNTHAGHISLEGRRVRLGSPGDAFALGMAYLPEERKTDGLFLKMPLRQNISVTALRDVSRLGIMNPHKEVAIARRFVERLGIVTPSVHQLVGRLSGGNQQKVMISKWLARQPKLLIIDEPTKGVDVGAKVEIHALLRELARQGVGILFVSSELPEIIGLSDRILVMHEGRLIAELPAEEADEQALTTLASGYSVEDASSGV